MVDHENRLKFADKLADKVFSYLSSRGSASELVTALLEYRCAQALEEEELSFLLNSLAERLSTDLENE